MGSAQRMWGEAQGTRTRFSLRRRYAAGVWERVWSLQELPNVLPMLNLCCLLNPWLLVSTVFVHSLNKCLDAGKLETSRHLNDFSQFTYMISLKLHPFLS